MRIRLIFIALLCAVYGVLCDNDDGNHLPRGHGEVLGRHRDSEGHVDILTEMPSPEDFWNNYASIRKPVVFRAPGLNFPATSLWTDDYLKSNFGDLEVKLEHKFEKGKTPVGSRGVGRDTIKTFLDSYLTEPKYIVSQLPDQMTRDVLVLPFLMCGSFYERLLEANLWLSSGGTKSMLHRDADNAINCLLNGTKDWILIDPKHEKNIPIAEGDSGYGGFAVLDVNKVNLVKYPKFKDVPWWYANMSAGDCLYLPYGYWHQVRSYGTKNMATTTLFSRLEDFDGSDCASKKLDYTPLNDTGMVWTYPGHGPQTLGNLDPFELKGQLLDDFRRRTKMTQKKYARKHPAVAEGEPWDAWKEAAMEMGGKIVEILDKDEKGYVVVEDIKKVTVQQLKEVAMAMDPDPANSDEYELYMFQPNEVQEVIRQNYDEQKGILTKEALVNAYVKFGGSKIKGEELFSLLRGEQDLTELPIDHVESRMDVVLQLFSKRQRDDPSGKFYDQQLKADQKMMDSVEHGSEEEEEEPMEAEDLTIDEETPEQDRDEL